MSTETTYDPDFLTPSTHQGVTFVASTGDSGSPGVYPAYSPRVLAVGGTSLTLNANNTYNGEVAWNNSTAPPAEGKTCTSPNRATNRRCKPAACGKYPTSPSTPIPTPACRSTIRGMLRHDSSEYGTYPWEQYGGTSLAAPGWAGPIAIADQLRMANGLTTLNSNQTQIQTLLYSFNAADFHDITSGSNGAYPAGRATTWSAASGPRLPAEPCPLSMPSRRW